MFFFRNHLPCYYINLRQGKMKYSSKNYIKHIHPSSLYQYTLTRFFHKFHSVYCRTGAQSILEIGCGEGFVLDYLAKREPDINLLGIDINKDAIKMASMISASMIKYICANGQNIPFQDNSFDLVILSEVLEHVEEPEQTLKDAIRVSKSYLLITIPLEPYFQTVANILNSLKLADDPDHINFWTKSEFQRWLKHSIPILHYEICDLYQLALCKK